MPNESLSVEEVAKGLSGAPAADLIAIRQNRTLVRRGLMQRRYYAHCPAALTPLGLAVRAHIMREKSE
jgi:hypothetical protein